MMVLGAIGSLVSGLAAIQQAQYQAAIAKRNAEQERINAQNASLQGAMDVQDLGAQRRGELGELEAAQGASGLAIGSLSFGLGTEGYRERAIEEAFRTQLSANQQTSYHRNAARIFDAEANAAKASIPFTILGTALNIASSIPFGSSSLVGGARSSPQSPGYLPLTQRRPTIGAPIPRPNPIYA